MPAYAQTAYANPVSFTSSLSEPVFGGKIYYRAQGNPRGPAVLLVHGLGDNASRMWEDTARKLQNNYFIYTFDLPGFGRSEKGNKLYSPEKYVELIRFLRQNQIKKPFHLVGHSMGGAIALRYAATYPEDVQTLTLIDVAGILYRLAYTKYLAPMGLEWFSDKFIVDRQLVSSWAGRLLNKAEGLVQFDPQYLLSVPLLRDKILSGEPAKIAGLALVLDNFNQMPQKIQAPTQIIWGENDTIAPVRTAHVLKALIPKAELVIVKKAAHNPVLEQSDLTHKLILRSIEAPQASTAVISQRPAPPPKNRVNCLEQNNVRYTGTISLLQLENCNNVLIENAVIGQLIINNSRVEIRNTRIDSNTTSIRANHSDITITAASIEGKVAIRINDTRLDIAGSELKGVSEIIVAEQASSVIFSLSQAVDRDSMKPLHGRVDVGPGNAL